MKLHLKILIGPNGSGKTTYINNQKNKYITNFKKKFVDLSIENESLDQLHKGKTSLFQTKMKEFDKSLLETNLKDINEQASKIIQNQKLENKIDLDIAKININENNFFPGDINIKIVPTIETRDIFHNKWIFQFNGKNVEINNAPSGVKKLMLLYLKINEEFNNPNNEQPRFLSIEEIENYLHPSWIKICISLLIGIFEKFIFENDIALISTHSPEVLVLLNHYIDYFATPINSGEDVRLINWKIALEKYEEINSNIDKHTPLNGDIIKYKNKIQTRLSFQLARFLFEKESSTILCEGITDQMFFKKLTSKLVVNSFGYFNFGLYISLYYGLYGELNQNIKIIADGDGKLNKTNSNQQNLYNYFCDNFGTNNVYYFEHDIEVNLYNAPIKEKRRGYEKFLLLEENINAEISNDEYAKLISFLKN